jgi:tyrocidine synthetase-1
MKSFAAGDERPITTSVVDAFEKICNDFPDGIALVSEYHFISYRELNTRANSLANFLRTNLKVKIGDVVAVLAEKSERTIVSLLATLKVGATYLPIEPNYPDKRLSTILTDSGAAVIMIESRFFHKVKDFSKTPMFALDFQLHTLPRTEQHIDRTSLPFDNAYLIFTSGSTGTPKGVLIGHAALANMINSQVREFGVQPLDRILQFASIGFDVSLFETFLSLTSGAALYLISNKVVKNKELFWDFIYLRSLHICVIPPSYFPYIDLKKFGSVRVVCTGGELVSAPSVKAILDDGKTVINQYGLTETACNALIAKLDRHNFTSGVVPIGGPIQNTTVYILDDQLNIVSRGEQGQICISGRGLFERYIGSPELTSERLIENPYTPGEKLFLTGDIGVMSKDGAVHFKERLGQQIKIRQHRVEINEIRDTFLKFPTVLDAFIDCIDTEDEKILVAYYTATKQASVPEVRKFVASYLPEYMIPSSFYQVENLPITINGKIDRYALQQVEHVLTTVQVPALPSNDTESQLLNIWKTVLGASTVSPDDNFFEIGGNSIKVIKVYEKLNAIFVDSISISDLYDNPTVRKQASLLEGKLLLQSNKDVNTISF